MNIAPAQLRAARALLGWSQATLAERSKVARTMIAGFESGKRKPNRGNLTTLEQTLTHAGVLFIEAKDEGAGVRMKKQR